MRSKRGLRKISANFSFLVKPYVIKAPENVSAVAGDEIDLACVVGGRPKPELQWIRQSGDIPPNRAIVRENSVLNLRNVSPDDQDTYICRADNPAGSVEVKASLQVHCNYILMTLVAALSSLWGHLGKNSAHLSSKLIFFCRRRSLQSSIIWNGRRQKLLLQHNLLCSFSEKIHFFPFVVRI